MLTLKPLSLAGLIRVRSGFKRNDLFSTLGGFGPRRPTKEAKKSVLATTKRSAKEYVNEK
jgi:hypothetical protein